MHCGLSNPNSTSAFLCDFNSATEIRVAGTLPPEALLDFDQLNASVEPVGTMLHGVLPDQAALYGLLTRLEALGAQVLEVRRLHDREPAEDD